MRLLGWNVKEVNRVNVFIRNIPFLGKVAKVQRYVGRISTKNIDAGVVYLEPADHEPKGLEKAKNCFVPSKTIQIDLTKSEEFILKNMKQKTRYNIKIAKKNDIRIEKTKDINAFLDLWHKSARDRGMWLSQRKEIGALWSSFKKDALLYFASISDEVLAGLFVVHTKDVAYYIYAASTKNGKEFFAPTLLTWEAIKAAKRNEKKVFDFDGIYDERYKNTDNWRGFTKFKEGFGGEIITYPGTFVKYFNPLLKILNF